MRVPCRAPRAVLFVRRLWRSQIQAVRRLKPVRVQRGLQSMPQRWYHCISVVKVIIGVLQLLA